MDVLLSAVASDVIGRLVSFLISKYQEPSATADAAAKLQRALLRARAVVEEAEGRQIANRAMLLQLSQLRRELCRGAYTLDAFRWRAADPILAITGVAAAVESLEAALGDVRELVVLLGACPPRVTRRQPYCAYLFMESCMFGRQMEKEQLVSFLLQPPAQDLLAVLPIIGAHDVGKRTLVEHVCLDERVRGHFTWIHRLGSDDLDRDHEQHDSSLMDDATTARSLFVVDLADGEDAWRRFLLSMSRRESRESKVVIISRTERHSALGTVPPLRLLPPRREELWYLFRGLAFGGADPEDRPDLARIAVALFEGFMLLDVSPFTTVSNLAATLRSDMTARAWRRVLNVSAATTVFLPDHSSHTGGEIDNLPEFCFLCRPVRGDACRSTPFLFCDRRKSTTRGDHGELPRVTLLELVTGRAAVDVGETRFDVLVWRSRIPPYASYVVACDVERARRVVVAGEKRVRKRRRGQ
ncbi:hypothetical protein EJB05_31894, partial [Eragrostis curvula]